MASARDRALRAPSARTRVKRIHDRARYDREAVHAVLDAGLVCHLGFVHEGHPFVIPTLHARVGEEVLIHGSAAARSLRALSAGIPVCLTVTLLDGLVLARSVFEHSVNYRSVVILGTATAITDHDEKLAAFDALTERLLPGRWADARTPTAKEVRATSILRLPIDEASAKIRDGGPEDDDLQDAHLDIWAGTIPLTVSAGAPIPSEGLRAGIPVPSYARKYRRPGLTA